jgi:hypothetical protein
VLVRVKAKAKAKINKKNLNLGLYLNQVRKVLQKRSKPAEATVNKIENIGE